MKRLRYTYLGDKLTAPALAGMQCDPIKRPDGRCVVARLQTAPPELTIVSGCVRITMLNPSIKRSMGAALVMDETGAKQVVIRRRLRLNAKD